MEIKCDLNSPASVLKLFHLIQFQSHLTKETEKSVAEKAVRKRELKKLLSSFNQSVILFVLAEGPLYKVRRGKMHYIAVTRNLNSQVKSARKIRENEIKEVLKR